MLKKYITISRPRFWVYVLGPFWLCGAIFYPSSVQSVPLLVFLVYFTFPANILIYGINDLYDRATDVLNAKKNSYEEVLDKKYDKELIRIILLTNIPFLIYGFFVLPQSAFVCLLVFVLLSWQYSAPPVRAKAVPFLDSILSGLLYIVPAGISWGIFTGSYPALVPMLAGFLWSYAMHLYSAVPDITADKVAGIKTGATLLGKNTTLVLCGVLYAASAVIAYFYIGFFAGIAGLGYLYLIFISIKKNKPEEVLAVYKVFPFFNTLVGALLFAILFFFTNL